MGYSSTKNIPEQSTSVLLPKKRMLKSNVMRETASVCDTGNGKLGAIGVERKTRSTCNTVIDGKDGELGSMSNQIGFHYDVETWLQNQPSLPHTDSQEMGISSRNPHVSVAFPLDKHYPSVDMVTDQQLCSSSQFTSVSAYRPCQKIIGSYPSDKQDSNFGKIHVTKSQKPLNNQSSTSRTEFSNVAISSDVNKISPHNERSEVLVDLSLIDDDGDTELFCDASIPSSFLYGKGLRMPEPQELTSRMSEGGQSDLFLKTSNKVKQTSAPLSKEMGATYNNIKDVQKPYRSQPISICNTYPISSKSSEIFLPKVNQDKIISKEGSTECNLNLPSYPQKVSKSPLPGENLIPERTSGGFCIPNICQRNYSYMRQNRSVTSASSKDMENRQKNTYERFKYKNLPHD